MMESQIADKELKERTGWGASFRFAIIVTLAVVVAGAVGIGMWWVIVPSLCISGILIIAAVHNKETSRSAAKQAIQAARARERRRREEEAEMDYEKLSDEATRQCVGLGAQDFTSLCKQFGIHYSGGILKYGFDASAQRFAVELRRRGWRDVPNVVGGIVVLKRLYRHDEGGVVIRL